MGGCATKPKVLKGEEDIAPAPEPETANIKQEGSEDKEVVVRGEGEKLNSTTHEEEGEKKKIQGGNEEEEEKVKMEEGCGDGDIQGDAVKKLEDDRGNKPRTLSNLFKENEKQKESSGNDVTTTQSTVVVPPLLQPVTHEEKPSLPAAETAEEVKSTLPVIPASAETIKEEKPVMAATTDLQVLEEKTENEKEKRSEVEKGVIAKDVRVTEKAINDDNRQEKPVIAAAATDLQKEKTEDENEKGVVAKDVIVKEKAINDYNRQEKLLMASSTDVREEKQEDEKEKRKAEDKGVVVANKDVLVTETAIKDDNRQEKKPDLSVSSVATKVAGEIA